MASNDLTNLVTLWTPFSHTASLPFGVGKIADPNPERLAIGFSRNALISAAVFPVVPGGTNFMFQLKDVDDIWIWWYKHGPIVGLQWNFTNFGGGASQITVMEILRTSVGD
jgi:hypothetical protein